MMLALFFTQQSAEAVTPDYFDLVVKILGIVGALIAAFKAIDEIRASRIQRERDYRWKQTNAAKELIDEMMKDKLAIDATIMLDWNGNTYIDDKQNSFVITHDDIKHALRTVNLKFTDKEKYIRDAFDKFLNYLEYTEQFIRNDLFKYEDIVYPMDYYINTAKEMEILPILKTYMKEYKFNNSLAFIERVIV